MVVALTGLTADPLLIILSIISSRTENSQQAALTRFNF